MPVSKKPRRKLKKLTAKKDTSWSPRHPGLSHRDPAFLDAPTIDTVLMMAMAFGMKRLHS